jgi:hypothetical protein
VRTQRAQKNFFNTKGTKEHEGRSGNRTKLFHRKGRKERRESEKQKLTRIYADKRGSANRNKLYRRGHREHGGRTQSGLLKGAGCVGLGRNLTVGGRTRTRRWHEGEKCARGIGGR